MFFWGKKTGSPPRNPQCCRAGFAKKSYRKPETVCFTHNSGWLIYTDYKKVVTCWKWVNTWRGKFIEEDWTGKLSNLIMLGHGRLKILGIFIPGPRKNCGDQKKTALHNDKCQNILKRAITTDTITTDTITTDTRHKKKILIKKNHASKWEVTG